MAAGVFATEEALGAYIVTTLGPVADVLNWHVLSDVSEVVNDALLAYGVGTPAAAEDITKIRLFAQRAAWQAAVLALPVFYDFTRPDGSYSRSQMLRGAAAALAIVEQRIEEAGLGNGIVHINSVVRTQDPYDPYPRGSEWGA